MFSIKKLTASIRPARKIFSVRSEWGRIFDLAISLEGSKHFRDIKFSNFSEVSPEDRFTLSSPNSEIVFGLSSADISLTTHTYSSKAHLKIEDFQAQFESLWEIANKILHIQNIHFIGIVAEHRSSANEGGGKRVAQKIPDVPITGSDTKAAFHIEEIFPLDSHNSATTSNRLVTVLDVYDSRMDTDHKEKDAVNINLDVQRIYTPSFNGDVKAEFGKHSYEFQKRWTGLKDSLRNSGLYKNE